MQTKSTLEFGPSNGASSLHHCAWCIAPDLGAFLVNCQADSHKNYDIKIVYDRLYFTNMTEESVSQQSGLNLTHPYTHNLHPYTQTHI